MRRFEMTEQMKMTKEYSGTFLQLFFTHVFYQPFFAKNKTRVYSKFHTRNRNRWISELNGLERSQHTDHPIIARTNLTTTVKQETSKMMTEMLSRSNQSLNDDLFVKQAEVIDRIQHKPYHNSQGKSKYLQLQSKV